MARVTVQDCVGDDKTNNRFELVKLAAQRAKDIHSGAPMTVPEDNDKKTVIALREIAAKTVKIKDLRERFINSLHPQSAIGTLDEELEATEKEAVQDEFAVDQDDIGLTEEQMLVDGDSSMNFEDIDLSEQSNDL